MSLPSDPAVVAAVCDGPWRPRLLAVRIARARDHRLVTTADRALATLLVDAFPDGATTAEVTRLLTSPDVVRWWSQVLEQTPPAPRDAGPLHGLADVTDLVAVLDVPLAELEHLARRHRPDADDGPLPARHYHHAVRPTRGGGVRVIAAPKPRLKEVQRRVLHRVVEGIPVHPAAFGTAPGRGVVRAVGRHAGAGVVVGVDLERFFTALTDTRVTGWFVHQGAAPEVARLLGRLTTAAVPRGVRRALPPLPGPDEPDRTWRRDRELAARHLPQGAPTSPALADRIGRALDVRLTALAARRGLVYTRYVDDLTFSGPGTTDTAYLLRTVAAVVRDEGFRLNPDKTRVQRSSGRQRALGAVVNRHPTLSRAERDALKATVHNCRVHGWRTQLRDEPAEGFRERLTGRVAWLAALDPDRGRRLLAALDAVDWT